MQSHMCGDNLFFKAMVPHVANEPTKTHIAFLVYPRVCSNFIHLIPFEIKATYLILLSLCPTCKQFDEEGTYMETYS